MKKPSFQKKKNKNALGVLREFFLIKKCAQRFFFLKFKKNKNKTSKSKKKYFFLDFILFLSLRTMNNEVQIEVQTKEKRGRGRPKNPPKIANEPSFEQISKKRSIDDNIPSPVLEHESQILREIKDLLNIVVEKNNNLEKANQDLIASNNILSAKLETALLETNEIKSRLLSIEQRQEISEKTVFDIDTKRKITELETQAKIEIIERTSSVQDDISNVLNTKFLLLEKIVSSLDNKNKEIEPELQLCAQHISNMSLMVDNMDTVFVSTKEKAEKRFLEMENKDEHVKSELKSIAARLEHFNEKDINSQTRLELLEDQMKQMRKPMMLENEKQKIFNAIVNTKEFSELFQSWIEDEVRIRVNTANEFVAQSIRDYVEDIKKMVVDENKLTLNYTESLKVYFEGQLQKMLPVYEVNGVRYPYILPSTGHL